MTASRARTWVQGVVALAALTITVAGVPIWLDAVAGSPIPRTIPDVDQLWASLTRRDDGTLLLTVVKYAAWAGWALFVSSVLADVVTRVRGLPAPRLGPQQRLASQLVSAVIALAVSLPTSMAASAAPMPTTSVTHIATAAPPGSAGAGGIAQATTSMDAADAVQRYAEYTVRRGDCLWDIAWNELGEPERWPEIYAASRRLAQPHGRLLSDPDLILPGWVLHIPVPSPTAGRHTSEDPQPAPKVPMESPLLPGEARVVTPLFGPASQLRQVAGPTDVERVQPRVATPLNTLRPATTVSALEERWIHALAERDDSAALREDWRRRLTGGAG